MSPNMTFDGPDYRAEWLAASLSEVPLEGWQAAAHMIAADPRAPGARAALARALARADRVRLWWALDEVEAAAYRLSKPGPERLLGGEHECARMRDAARDAVTALVCDNVLAAGDVHALAAPLLVLAGTPLPRLPEPHCGRTPRPGRPWPRGRLRGFGVVLLLGCATAPPLTG